MNHTSTTPRLSDSNDLMHRQLHNVFCILANPDHKMRGKAQILRQCISDKWRIQAIEEQWFPWPTTIAPIGSRRLKGLNWRPHGMLGYLGYHVGETQPTSPNVRQCILEYAFECYLPPLNDRAYYLEWGQPHTAQRLKKIADSIAAFARNAKRRNIYSYARAIDDWEHDLDFLRNKYYEDYFHFGWPEVDSFH